MVQKGFCLPYGQSPVYSIDTVAGRVGYERATRIGQDKIQPKLKPLKTKPLTRKEQIRIFGEVRKQKYKLDFNYKRESNIKKKEDYFLSSSKTKEEDFLDSSKCGNSYKNLEKILNYKRSSNLNTASVKQLYNKILESSISYSRASLNNDVKKLLNCYKKKKKITTKLSGLRNMIFYHFDRMAIKEKPAVRKRVKPKKKKTKSKRSTSELAVLGLKAIYKKKRLREEQFLDEVEEVNTRFKRSELFRCKYESVEFGYIENILKDNNIIRQNQQVPTKVLKGLYFMIRYDLGYQRKVGKLREELRDVFDAESLSRKQKSLAKEITAKYKKVLELARNQIQFQEQIDDWVMGLKFMN